MKLARLLSIVMAITLLLPACGATSTPAPAATKAPGAAPTTAAVGKWTGPRFGGVLNAVSINTMPTSDTCCVSSAVTQWLSLLIHETLVGFSENYQVKPMVAKSWEISSDGLTYTFPLRQGLKFHNGQEMTSEDVVASIKRYVAIGARSSFFKGVLASYEATDKYTVVMKLSKPSGLFLTNLAHLLGDLAILPKSLALKADGTPREAQSFKAPDEIIGLGPYKLVSYNPDNMLVFKRNDDYQVLPGEERDGNAGPKIPYFDEIRLHIVLDLSVAAAGLETGDYDIVPYILAPDFQRFAAGTVPGVTAIQSYPGGVPVLMFNMANAPATKLEFRQAVAAVMDWEEVALVYVGGQKDGFRLNPYIWPKEGGMYLPDCKICDETYNKKDIEKGKALLKASGYNGEPVILMSTSGDGVIQNIADQLKNKLGINTKVEFYDWPTVLQKATDEKTSWHIWTSAWESFQFVPMAMLSSMCSTCKGSMNSFYASTDMDKIIERVGLAVTREEQVKAWTDFQNLWYADANKIKMFDVPMPVGMRSNIKGYKGWYRPIFYGVWREK